MRTHEAVLVDDLARKLKTDAESYAQLAGEDLAMAGWLKGRYGDGSGRRPWVNGRRWCDLETWNAAGLQRSAEFWKGSLFAAVDVAVGCGLLKQAERNVASDYLDALVTESFNRMADVIYEVVAELDAADLAAGEAFIDSLSEVGEA